MKRLARGAGNVLGRVSGRVSDLVKVLGGVIVIGSPVYMGGCEMNDAQILGAFLGAVAPYSEDMRAGAAVSALGSGIGSAGNAEAGKTTVNVYGNLQKPKSQADIFLEKSGRFDILQDKQKSNAEIIIEKSGG